MGKCSAYYFYISGKVEPRKGGSARSPGFMGGGFQEGTRGPPILFQRIGFFVFEERI
jgi:hypothetical protein